MKLLPVLHPFQGCLRGAQSRWNDRAREHAMERRVLRRQQRASTGHRHAQDGEKCQGRATPHRGGERREIAAALGERGKYTFRQRFDAEQEARLSRAPHRQTDEVARSRNQERAPKPGHRAGLCHSSGGSCSRYARAAGDVRSNYLPIERSLPSRAKAGA